jgi:hypothetical protein
MVCTNESGNRITEGWDVNKREAAHTVKRVKMTDCDHYHH